MKFTKRIKIFYQICKKLFFNPKSIFEIFKDETEWKKYLHKKYKFTTFPSVDIRNFLTENKGEISDFNFLDGSSLVTDLVLLKSLAEKIPDCNYLEIGMFRGESIVNVAQTAKKCTAINLSKQEIISLGMPKKYADLLGILLRNNQKINIIFADSLKFDFKNLNEKFDLIFIDGDHKYEAVKSDTKNVFGLLKDENSVIVWHDYAYTPEKPRYSVIAGILDGLPETEFENLYHVSNTMCAIYTKKKFLAKKYEFPAEIDKVFKVKIEVQPFENQ